MSMYDLTESARIGHWRGFTKYRQPDGRIIGDGGIPSTIGKRLLIGPAPDVYALDLLILDFYSRNRPDRD